MTLAEAANHPWLAPATHAAAEVPLPASIVDRLRGFTQENRLTALLMTLVAHHLSDAAIEDLRHTFDRLDTDHDGLVGVADITAALQSAGVDCKSQGIPDLVARLDVGMTHIGQISVDEFLAAALDRKAVFTQSAVNRVFKELDVDGDGKLSVTALAEALAECGVPVPSEVLRRMMDREGALDGRGVVSARSFADLLEVGAEEQGRPAAAAAMDGLPAFGRRGSLDAPIGQQLSLSRLSLGRQVSLTSNGTLSPDLVSPEAAEGSTGRNLDQILRQYSMSGWKTPKRRQGLAMGSVSPTIAKQTLASAASTPSSLASPTIAHLGYD